MAKAMDRHNEIIDAAVSRRGGVRPAAQGEGDSMVAAFSARLSRSPNSC